MQKVLSNIAVENPTRDVDAVPLSIQRPQLDAYNRAEEEAKIGNFELEEGIRNILAVLDSDCTYNLDETRDLNSNIDNLIRAQNIQRG